MYSYCNLFTSSSSLFMIGIIILILIQVPLSLCQENHQYETCRESFRCLDIENISYPFYGRNRPDYCGHPGFLLTNCDGEYGNFLAIEINSFLYSVLAIDKNVSSLTVRREDLLYNLCSSGSEFGDTRLNFTLFDYGPDERNLTLYYDCPTGPTLHRLPCRMNSERANYFMPDIPDEGNMEGCKREIKVPINQTSYQILTNPSASIDDLKAALAAGFGLNYLEGDTNCSRCLGSGGLCGHNWPTDSFTCYCKEGSYPLDCSDTQKKGDNSRRRRQNMKKNIVLAVSIVAAAVGVMGIGWLIFFCRQRRKRLVANSAQTQSKELPGPTTMSNKRLIFPPSSMFTGSVASYPSSMSNFGKGNSYFGVQVFSYTELEEATDNFDSSRELGDGGFGTVYCGQLRDGRIVAIKRLYENNCRRVEQFMNELEILTRLHHDNLVILYGCTSRRSRELLLVYEYIPNGTVADHLHGKRAKSGLLSWPVRLSIAVETADALAYLHESDIIHRDVKTNNILLDNEFHVKVADFGLSRLFPNDVSHVSTAPQGTPGYVDPEYYQCYQLTEKSDVYSFGVVLIELISSLQAVDICRHRHDINLSNMAINKIQNGVLHELVDPSLGFATYSSVRRTTTLVAELAFRCLQHEKDMRPSMREVLDTLRRIRNEGMNTKEVEVVDILVDEGAPLNGNPPPHSPDSVITDKWVSNSTTDSSC